MTREIKFRGKDIHGEWHYGYLFRGYDGLESYSLILDGKIFDCDNDMPDKYSACFCENEVAVVRSDTIGQYTGLTDKNGKEIYEGDILRSVKFKDIIIFVLYDEEEASFMAVQINKYRGTDLETRCHIRQEWIDNYPKEVIGNIYDNPELMDKNKRKLGGIKGKFPLIK